MSTIVTGTLLEMGNIPKCMLPIYTSTNCKFVIAPDKDQVFVEHPNRNPTGNSLEEEKLKQIIAQKIAHLCVTEREHNCVSPNQN